MNNTNREATLSIPVDLLNPGQFFACCGLLELAHRKWGMEAKGTFDDNHFYLYAPISVKKLNTNFFQAISLISEKPDDPVCPIQLCIKDQTMILNWWLDITKGSNKANAMKTWSGNQKISNLLNLFLTETRKTESVAAGFQNSINLKGRLGVDSRSSWNKIDAGFSPNTIGIEIPTYVMVEFLTAIGLQRFRPTKINQLKGYSTRVVKWNYFVWKCDAIPVQLACIVNKILPEEKIQQFEFMIRNNGKYRFFSRATRA